MRPRYDLVTFDCYGTLVDWAGGIDGAFRGVYGPATPSRNTLLALHAEIEPRIQRGPWRPYREVLTETAQEMARRLGLSPADDGGFLANSLPGWPVFADTLPALRRLSAAGVRLGVLSNIDDDLLAGTLAPWDVTFDIRVTAESLRSYKPAPAHFHEAARRVGKMRWLHAAQSRFHDIVPVTAAGVPAAWINRGGEVAADEAATVCEAPDVAGLADWMLGGGN
jgi:2-haloalkanoic acid dehalogenase type II